jgi:glycosyltransferase involved in cell wall biosynthesis
MYKVADYLIQSQAAPTPPGFARFQPLDTRAGSHPVYSLWVLTTALMKLIGGRISGRLAGVHVNMAEKLSVLRKGLVVIVGRALGLPVVLHLHAAQLHHFYRRLPRPFQALVRWTFSIASVVIVLGTASRRFVVEELHVPPEKVRIIINGVPDPSVARRRYGESDTQRVLFLGNLSERKGVTDLLNALALPGFDRSRLRVDITGGGDLEAYRAKAAEAGVTDFVRFVGWADQASAAELLANADVLVLPSYDEGLPLVILEALANAVAVVCTPVGEIPSVFVDGVNACFVRPGDIQSIAAGLQRVLGDSALRDMLERNGRAMFEQHFSLARFFAHIAEVHRQYIGTCAQFKDSNEPPQVLSE